MVTMVLVVTGVVLIVKLGETVAPAVTVTEDGTVVLGSLLAKLMTAPPLGAGPLSVT